MTHPDPFSVLEIAPTLDQARVKRAYFSELQKHPPHTDPEGFRRLRTAYEALTRPGALPLAFISAPFDVAAELDAWHSQWDEPTRLATDHVLRVNQDSQAIRSFVTTTSRLRFDEAVVMFAEPEP